MPRLFFFLLLLFHLHYFGTALDCIQCDLTGRGLTDEEHEEKVKLCQEARLDPIPCTNRSHTQCIVSWFSKGVSGRTVTERRCGSENDITGCTLYNSKNHRKVRHLLNNKVENRREEVPSFIEVCSQSCPFGDCVNSSRFLTLPTFLALIIFI